MPDGNNNNKKSLPLIQVILFSAAIIIITVIMGWHIHDQQLKTTHIKLLIKIQPTELDRKILEAEEHIYWLNIEIDNLGYQSGEIEKKLLEEKKKK